MAGFLEVFVRYVDEIGGDPVQETAERVRAGSQGRRARDRATAERRAADIERIGQVLGLGGQDR
jgi:hypothetical protein